MKINIVMTLVIVTCVCTLLPFESVNGDGFNAGIKIISSNGSYIPGEISTFFFQKKI